MSTLKEKRSQEKVQKYMKKHSDWFNMMLQMTNEGGMLLVPEIMVAFKKVNGKFVF